MISYSDYILAEKPWAYWPLNDPSISGFYPTGSQTILDVSGNNRHLTETRSTQIKSFHNIFLTYTYTTNFNGELYNEATVPVDSLPIRGIEINNTVASSTSTRNNLVDGPLYINDYHDNDVTIERYTVSHKIYHNKIRCEFLLHLPQLNCKTSDRNPNCKPVKYPLLNVGGMSLWVETTYSNPNCIPRDCPDCIMSESRIQMFYAIDVIEIPKNGNRNRYFTEQQKIIDDMEIIFPGLNKDWTRIIIECEYINDKSMRFKYWQKNTSMFEQIITIPELEDIGDYFYDKKFRYQDDWKKLYVNCIRGIANMSLYYDRNSIDNDYLIKSWEALTSDYIPQLYQDTIMISNKHLTNIKFESLPNTTQMQLDSLLVRGINHQRFSIITSEDWFDGSKVKLWLGTYDNRQDGDNQSIQDFNIGDVISLNGSSQLGLDGCWAIEELYENGVAFLANHVFDDEERIFYC